MKIFKKIILLIGLGTFFCIALYYCVLLVILNFADLNKYKISISDSIEKSTGFKISCENIAFKKSLSPYLQIHMFHTIVLYPDNEVFLKLKETDLQVKILPLLMKKIVIKDAVLKRPIINITLYKDFSTSIEKYINTPKTFNTKGFKLDSAINDTICQNYKIKYKDESINKTFYLEGSELVLNSFKFNDKIRAKLKGSIFEGENEYIRYDIDVISALNSAERHFTFSPFKTILDSNVKGDIKGHLKIDRENNITGNLKINDFSLKLDSIISRNNTADLIFNGKEVEINSLLHASDTDSASIKGKFNFGKNKYINLNTNAKNIKIDNLIKIISKISKVLNFKNPLNDIKGNGLFDADFNVNSDFKKLKSSGSAKIINASFSHKSLPFPITDINASFNFDNNNISIENASAKINETPLYLKGTVNEDVTFNIKASSENLNLVNLINLFDLNNKFPVSFLNGKLSFESDITGVLNKSYNIHSKINLTDLSFKDKKFNLPIFIKSTDLNFSGNKKNYKGEILCSKTDLKLLKQNIFIPEIKLNFDENQIAITANKLTSPLDINIEGSITDYNKTPSGSISFKGDIASNFIADIVSREIKLPYKAAGTIQTTGKIDFNSGKLNIKSRLKADENNYISYAVIKELLNKPSIVNIDCEITDNIFNIKDLSLHDNSNSEKNSNIILAEGQIKKEKEITFNNFKINIPNAMSIAANFFGGEEISFSADLLLNKTITNPEIKGNAKVFKYNLKKYLTSIKNADISFNSDNIRIIAPDAVVNESSFNIIADIAPFSFYNLKNIIISNLQINSMKLDLNSLFPLIKKETNPFAEAIFTVKKGFVTVNEFKVLDLTAKDISTDMRIEKNIIKLSNINAGAYAGRIEGKLDYDIAHSSIDMNITGKGLDIKTSLYDLCKIKDDLEGKFDFTVKMSMTAGIYNEVLKSMNGNLKFRAYNGKMGTLGKFEYYLYAQNLIYHGIMNATLNRIANAIVRDDTAKYKQANGTLIFQNGYILTDSIETTGSNMSLFMKGKHNLITNIANIDIYGRISDEVRQKLGTFGNTSFSEIFNTPENKKNIKPIMLSTAITDKIPDLYNQKDDKTNIFKVNIYGNINSLNSINSFDWIVPNNYEEKEQLPNFSDMLQQDL